jgi:hypothetical protein
MSAFERIPAVRGKHYERLEIAKNGHSVAAQKPGQRLSVPAKGWNGLVPAKATVRQQLRNRRSFTNKSAIGRRRSRRAQFGATFDRRPLCFGRTVVGVALSPT